jgi:hypothetical protein
VAVSATAVSLSLVRRIYCEPLGANPSKDAREAR